MRIFVENKLTRQVNKNNVNGDETTKYKNKLTQKGGYPRQKMNIWSIFGQYHLFDQCFAKNPEFV